tara:strand:+ start:73 stop:330 length:258 start_codon:yes stop_codon:yes gene_type:complete
MEDNELKKQQNDNPIVQEFLDEMKTQEDPNITLVHNDLVEAIIESARDAISGLNTDNLKYEVSKLARYYWNQGGRDVDVDLSDEE